MKLGFFGINAGVLSWKRYQDLGVARLVLLHSWRALQGQPAPGSAAEDELIRFLESCANELLRS